MLNYNSQNQLCFSHDNKFSDPLINIVNNLKYEKPIYLYYKEELEHRVRFLKNTLSPIEIFYALKANAFAPIVQMLIKEGVGLDVVSLGEIECGLRNGCPPQKMIFSGVGKSHKEIEMAIRLKIRQINVESIPELLRISSIARSLNLKAPIALRVNPDVDAATHPYIATGLKNNKFGIETIALSEAENILHSNLDSLEFLGFSLHIGSQILDLNPFQEAFDKLKNIIIDWQSRGWIFNTLDAGGGLGINYTQDDFASEEKLAQQWSNQIKNSWKNNAENFFVEPGRWLVSHSGVLITKVEYIKKTSHHQFLIVDTGMHHLMRPALYQAKHRILPLIKNNNFEPQTSYQIVGPICESSDVINSEVMLTDNITEGDYLAILDTGAYGSSMSNCYNQRELPLELLI